MRSQIIGAELVAIAALVHLLIRHTERQMLQSRGDASAMRAICMNARCASAGRPMAPKDLGREGERPAADTLTTRDT